MPQRDHASRWVRQPTWESVLGGICWILSLEYLAAAAIAQAAWTTPYSLADDPISDLGNTACGVWPPANTTNQTLQQGGGHYYVCSPLHTVMNLSFILTGILLLLGLYLTRSIWPRRHAASTAVLFLAVAGMGKIVVGLDPENVRQFLFSLGRGGILCGDIGILALGLASWNTRRGVSLFSVILGMLGVVGYVSAVALSTSTHGAGTAERIADYTVIAWMVGLGMYAVVQARLVSGSAVPLQPSRMAQ